MTKITVKIVIHDCPNDATGHSYMTKEFPEDTILNNNIELITQEELDTLLERSITDYRKTRFWWRYA